MKRKKKHVIPEGFNVVAELANGKVGIECKYCEGEGLSPSDYIGGDYVETDPCPVCKGTGVNIILGGDQGIIQCRYCSASGRGWNESCYFSGEVCQVCRGNGYINLNEIVSGQAVSNMTDFWGLIHPEIIRVSKSRFDTGHFADAVEAAFKHFNVSVKRKVEGLVPSDLDGANLMNRVFSVDRPILALADLSTESGSNIQKGYMQMFAGGIIGIRNPKAHDNLTVSVERAIHLLYMASLYMFKLEESIAV